MIHLDDDERRRRLAWRHRLVHTYVTSSAVEITDDLVALHSSDPATVFLSLAARSDALTIADIERTLYHDRGLVRHHAMRRTLWVMTPSVASLAHAATTRKIAAAERAKAVKMLDGDTGWLDDAIARVAGLLRDTERPLTTREIADLLPEIRRDVVMAPGSRNEATVGAHTRAILLAAFEGRIARTRPAGSWVGTHSAWTEWGRWTDVDLDEHDVPTATARLVAAWLTRFGPATMTDIVWWMGGTKGAVRRALTDIEAETVELDGDVGFVLAGDTAPTPDPGPWVAVLPGLDPTPMGWKQRAWYLDGATAARVTDGYGNIGPTIWADGHIVGGWVQRDDGTLATELTQPVSAQHLGLLDRQLARITTFVGDTRFRVRFPSPNQTDLRSPT